jgi:hypothetical protein
MNITIQHYQNEEEEDVKKNCGNLVKIQWSMESVKVLFLLKVLIVNK